MNEHIINAFREYARIGREMAEVSEKMIEYCQNLNEEKKQEKTYTGEEVRAAMAQKAASGYKVQVMELLGRFGASKLGQLKETDYSAFMKELEEIK